MQMTPDGSARGHCQVIFAQIDGFELFRNRLQLLKDQLAVEIV